MQRKNRTNYKYKRASLYIVLLALVILVIYLIFVGWVMWQTY